MSQNMQGENSRLRAELNVFELHGQSIGLHDARVKVRHKNLVGEKSQARAANESCFVSQRECNFEMIFSQSQGSLLEQG
eukprot:1528313-Pleurochrysis_carterae.AAC.1